VAGWIGWIELDKLDKLDKLDWLNGEKKQPESSSKNLHSKLN